MYIGVIADDFTGGTDIAGFMTQNGLAVTQFIGIPECGMAFEDPHCAVISLKSRSCPPQDAVRDSLAALAWLQQHGCTRFFFKYCSTFDSSAKGNIGPVTDALMKQLGQSITVLAPGLPVNGRTVYCGNLFVNNVPLHESGMRNHPVTPMRDANLMRLMDAQAQGTTASIPYPVMEQGPESVRKALALAEKEGFRYAVPDTVNNAHLDTLAEAVEAMPLVTGGSGLGAALAGRAARKLGLGNSPHTKTGMPPGGRCVVLCGSASTMTNAQVARYREQAPAMALDVRRAAADPCGYARELAAWVSSCPEKQLAPLVSSTPGPDELAAIQKEFGAEVSGNAVETAFAHLGALLKQDGFTHFIVAGGETSGAVVKALGVKAFHIGPQIAPGVPWVRAVDQPLSLALKSGNFGDEAFFFTAQGFWQ